MGAFEPAAPSVEEVERIAALTDPVVRNLRITQAYHELSAAMAALTGPQANWNTFATWASRQAGQTIRQEDLSHLRAVVVEHAPNLSAAFTHVLTEIGHAGSVAHRLHIDGALGRVFDVHPAMARASDAIARGNLKVFAEIGREFARFLVVLEGGRRYRPEAFAAFAAGLRPGAAPDGQDLLREAFGHCYLASFEPDPKARAELMYLANVEIGFHEQTRLQPEIREAMDAVVDVLPHAHGLGHSLAALQRMLPAVEAVIAAEARLVVTRFMMTLWLPGRQLRLGADLRADFAELLRTLTNAELRALLVRFTPRLDDLRGSGALDWASLSDRMHFIADMFRVYHQEPTLLQPPFDAAQVDAFKRGERPAGPL